MRIYKSTKSAFNSLERTLWEAGLPIKEGHKSLRPCIFQVTNLEDFKHLYEGFESGKEVENLVSITLKKLKEDMRAVFKENSFFEAPSVIPDNPMDLELETITTRYMFDVNGKLHMTLQCISIELYDELQFILATSIEFQSLFAEANDLKVGCLYVTLHDLHEDISIMESKEIF